MIDAETFVGTLLARDIPGASIELERNIDSLATMPVLIYAISGDGQTANADGLWFVTLDLTAIANSVQEAFDTISAAYDAVHAWDTPGKAHTASLWVSSVSDEQYPSKDDVPDIGGKTVSQYSGSFALDLRSN